MVFDPLAATGLLTAQAGGQPEITGTCFLFRHDDTVFTAAHCVPQEPTRLIAQFPNLHRIEAVQSVVRHPFADVALLALKDQLAKADGYPEHAFWDRVSNWGLGEECFAYGFPTEGPIPGGAAEPVLPAVLDGNGLAALSGDGSAGLGDDGTGLVRGSA